MIKLVTYIAVFIVILLLACRLCEMSIGAALIGCFWLIPFCALRR